MDNIIKEHEAGDLTLLLEKVYRDSGYDFRDYRRGTVTRRLERRLYATGVMTYHDYMRFLDANPGEYHRFAEYLTIKVSGFFRSPYAYQQVAGMVLPEIVSQKKSRGERSLRVWSTACARGEEPYSIAILIAQFLEHQPQDFDINVYATDISRQALKEAQAGIYTRKEVANLTEDILQSYFTPCSEGYQVNDGISQMVRLSHFDLTSTTQPPFTNLDCIFCCNFLIYLQKQLQERVLDMLCDALAPHGYLVLGEVETPPAGLRDKLECLDKKAKIYRKKG